MVPTPGIQKPVIGLAGGIGSGKSTVARQFADLGCRLIDADAIGHELLREPDVLDRIRGRWADGALTPGGQVDRRALAEVVFADLRELGALNALLHPRIRRQMEREIAEALADGRAAGVVVDAAVLFEAGWDDLCTHRVFVAAPARQRWQRVSAGRSWSRADWQRREKSQIPLDKKRRKCDYTVDNRSSASRLREQVRETFQRIRHSGG